MAKDPAFLFYSQDFYLGVADLNFEDRGRLITLLCLMHQKGRMNEETIRFMVGSVSDNLRLKFKVDKDGLWYNERLEFEAEKRNNFVDSRKHNGSKGGRPTKKKTIIKPNKNHTVNLTEDENEIKNEDVIINNNSLEENLILIKESYSMEADYCKNHKYSKEVYHEMLEDFSINCREKSYDNTLKELKIYLSNFNKVWKDKRKQNGKSKSEQRDANTSNLTNLLAGAEQILKHSANNSGEAD